MKKMKSGEIFAVVVVAVMLVIGLGISNAPGQSVKPDTIKVEFALGSSVVPSKYNTQIVAAKEKIANGWTAEISGGANPVRWTNVGDNRTDALDGGKIVTRARSVAKALGLESFKPGVLTTDEKMVLVVLTLPQEKPASKAAVDSLGKKVAELDQKIDELGSKTDDELFAVKQQLNGIGVSKWSLLIGWQGVNFGNRRDLSVVSVGLRFRSEKFYAELAGGLDPWAKPGYNKLWFRDYLGTGRIGYFLHKNLAVEIGGLAGWEATSDTKTNHFSMQVLGVTAGLRAELPVIKIGPANISASLGVGYVRAEVNDMNQRIGVMRDGIVGSAGITVTF